MAAHTGRESLLKLRKVVNILLNRAYMSKGDRDDVVSGFHRLYYDAKTYGGTWDNTRWLGVPVLKNPFDLWVYQEILAEIRPDLIIETGTYDGGSAYYFASLLDLLGNGEIVSVDIDSNPTRPAHDRITYLTGSSVSDSMLDELRQRASGKRTVMVILDSDHSRDHVLAEMQRYHPFVTPGSYMVVEDSNVNGHPVFAEHGPGPMEAIEAFLAQNRDFDVDEAREKFFLTFNPRGWLRKRP